MEITLHGVIRLFVWLVSLGGFSYQALTMLEMYFKYPFSVTVVEQLQSGILFPAVTICSENWINRTRLCEASPEHCSADFSANVGSHYKIEYDFDLQNDVALKPQETLECYMRSNDPTCLAFTCFGAVRRSYYRHPGHMCYTFDLLLTDERRDSYLACKSPWTWELTLNVIWSAEKTMALQNDQSFPVIVHRPETTPPDKLSSLIAEAGMSYVLSVTQQATKRLPPPYASACTDYIKEGIALEMGGYQSQDTCLQKCRMSLESRFCGCVSPLYEYSAFFGKDPCPPDRDEKCQTELEQNRTYSKCHKICRAPCEETNYDVRLTGMSVIPEGTNVGFERFFIKVKFSSDTQKTFLYQPKLSIVEVFGYMGGYLGMWLGFSLFSILSGLEDKFHQFLLRRSEILRGITVPMTANGTFKRDPEIKPEIEGYNDSVRRRFMVREWDADTLRILDPFVLAYASLFFKSKHDG
ncbi:acid-sensing ion channel 1 [Galendromus occidentalis]|uniref:Acid-sensing ion channel 1 n=1 Tax=Galendromus occidentalis TaxID=34638 RepID=A0AAJ7WIG9_9ACAR|nr:acid-sensing ion channel 1 [Galendromus occidentalis]